MLDLKKKAISGIKGMLEDRMAGDMKPKAVEVDIAAMGKKPMDSEDAHEGPEIPGEKPDAEDVKEGPETGALQGKLPEDADLGALSPEEKQELERLYSKMGC